MSEPHEQLSEAMNARRRVLRMQWNQLATEAGVSSEALRAIRRGDYRPSDLTALRLDEAFRWEPGSVERILDGGKPIPLGQEDATRPPAAEAKAPAGGIDEDPGLALDNYVPKTEMEKALIAIFRADKRANEQRFQELSAKIDRIDRLAIVRDDDAERDPSNGEHDRQRKGA